MDLMTRARIKTIIALLVFALVLFGAAGTLAWLAGWLYLSVLTASTTLPLWRPFRFDDGLIAERMTPGGHAKRWDRPFVAGVAVLTPVELIVAGLDRRWSWSPPLPHWSMWAGLAGVIVGTAGLMWAMRTNRFFSVVVRLQTDRGHHVITSGPYRFVRHPGYATWMVHKLSLPWLFGSLWLYVPVGIFTLMFVIRTVAEDRMLARELPGYREYASRVRARLIPGLW